MAEWLPTRLPEDIEAERSLLATCGAPGMETRAADILARLEPADFVVPKHRALFLALRALVLENQEVNAITLKDTLERQGTLNEVEGFSGLVEMLMAEEVGRPEVLAKLIRRKAKLRKLVRLGAGLVRQASEEEEPPEKLIDAAAKGLFVLGADDFERPAAEPVELHEIATEKIHEEEDHRVAVQLPILPLHEMLGGLHAGNVAVLAARPGQGKTTLALQIALYAAQNRSRVGIWSLEMSREEVLDRMAVQVCAGWGPGHTRLFPGWARKGMGDREKAVLLSARDEMRSLSVSVCDDASVSPSGIRSAGLRATAKGNRYDLMIVDYIQLLGDDDPDEARRQNEATRVSRISRALKKTAKELGIPILVLAQLNREVEGRNGAPPRLSDLRDSGAIEADADQVVFIHRKLVDGVLDEQGQMLIAKNRHGACGRVHVTFWPEQMRFKELVRETGAPMPEEPVGRALELGEWG